MFQILTFRTSLWLWHVIFVMIQMGELTHNLCSIIIERFLLTFSIHPRYKHDVAYRLSRAGLGVAYNQSVEYLGPIPKAIDYEPGNPTVNIVYGSVSSIDQRSSSGFDVSDFCFHHTQLTRSAFFRFVVVELIV